MATTEIAVYLALVAGALGVQARGGRVVAAALRTLPDRPGIVELEVRNISQQALDAPVLAILTVTPAWDDEPSRQHWSIASSVDPTTGQFDGLYAERPSPPLRLPIRGSTRVRIDLDRLKWSLTPDLTSGNLASCGSWRNQETTMSSYSYIWC